MARISFIIIFFSCISLWAYTPISESKKHALIQEFNYTPQILVKQEGKGGVCAGDTLIYETSYPQLGGNITIEARTYFPKKSGAPIVVQLPPMGGVNILDKGMANTFCKNNIAVILVATNLTGFDGNTAMPMSDHDEAFRRAVAAIKGALSYASLKGTVDVDKAGIFGVSLGGILGSVAFGVMDELSAATLIVNGGDIPYILAYSDQEEVSRLRNIRMKQDGYKTAEEYESALRQVLQLDPMHFASEINPEFVKQYLSNKDENVPTIKQKEYHEAIGSPQEVQFYNSGHVSTVISVLFGGSNRQKIAQWFNDRFKLPNPRTIEIPFASVPFEQELLY